MCAPPQGMPGSTQSYKGWFSSGSWIHPCCRHSLRPSSQQIKEAGTQKQRSTSANGMASSLPINSLVYYGPHRAHAPLATFILQPCAVRPIKKIQPLASICSHAQAQAQLTTQASLITILQPTTQQGEGQQEGEQQVGVPQSFLRPGLCPGCKGEVGDCLLLPRA